MITAEQVAIARVLTNVKAMRRDGLSEAAIEGYLSYEPFGAEALALEAELLAYGLEVDTDAVARRRE